MRALIIGNSHVECLRAAKAKRPDLFAEAEIYRLATDKADAKRDGMLTFNRAVNLIESCGQEVPVFVQSGGTWHNTVGLIQLASEFYFLDGAPAAAEPSGMLIPHRTVEQWFGSEVERMSSVKRLTESAKAGKFLLGTPPPKQSNNFLEHARARRRDGGSRGLTVEAARFMNPTIRLKLWTLEQQLVHKWATKNQIEYVKVPQRSRNSDGFLARRFYGSDTTHANFEYGMLVLNQVLSIAKQTESVDG
jgi:hypothetical protein